MRDGPGFKSSPGDVLLSTITYDPTTMTMTVSVSEEDGSGISTYVAAHPWLDTQKGWSDHPSQSHLEVSIEAWNATTPASWPAEPASWPAPRAVDHAQR